MWYLIVSIPDLCSLTYFEGREGYFNSAHKHDFTGVYLMDFLLLRYSVLFTVESLSLLISFLFLDLYVLGDDALIS